MERPSPYRPRPEVEVATIRREAQSIVRAASSPAPKVEVTMPFIGHEQQFIRLALHLQPDRAGIYVPPRLVIQSDVYQLSDPLDYLAALGHEPRQLAGGAFSIIRRMPAPETFTRLWAADTARWLESVCPSKEHA